jgi:hypothetical protein
MPYPVTAFGPPQTFTSFVLPSSMDRAMLEHILLRPGNTSPSASIVLPVNAS